MSDKKWTWGPNRVYNVENVLIDKKDVVIYIVRNESSGKQLIAKKFTANPFAVDAEWTAIVHIEQQIKPCLPENKEQTFLLCTVDKQRISPTTAIFIVEKMDGDYEKLLEDDYVFVQKNLVSLMMSPAIALKALHSVGLLHRDIKLGNILYAIQDPLAIRVADFGAACFIGAKCDNSFAGTLSYLQPHFFQKDVLDDYHWSETDDLYALACVWYELITRRRVVRPALEKLLEQFWKGNKRLEKKIQSVFEDQWKQIIRPNIIYYRDIILSRDVQDNDANVRIWACDFILYILSPNVDVQDKHLFTAAFVVETMKSLVAGTSSYSDSESKQRSIQEWIQGQEEDTLDDLFPSDSDSDDETSDSDEETETSTSEDSDFISSRKREYSSTSSSDRPLKRAKDL